VSSGSISPKRSQSRQGAFGRVGNLHARLQRRAHQGHAAKGPQGQPAQALGRVAVHQRHALALAQRLQGGDDAGQAAADDQDVGRMGVCHAGVSPVRALCCALFCFAVVPER
jgi:hypothetical protein